MWLLETELLLNAEEGCSESQWDSCLPWQEKRKLHQLEINDKWGQRNEFCNLRSLCLVWHLLSDGGPQRSPSRTTTAAFALQTKHFATDFQFTGCVACQSHAASWGAVHGWVSCLLLHPLPFLAAVQSALSAPGQVAGLHYYSMHSPQPTIQNSTHAKDKYFTKKKTCCWAKDGWTTSSTLHSPKPIHPSMAYQPQLK